MKRKEINKNIQLILEDFDIRSFLEIGLGPRPRTSRMQVIDRNHIDFVGVDFQAVCDMHAAERDRLDISPEKMQFYGNTTGTYLFNLVRLKREGRKFDFVYLDGHHTLYVDFPAAMACLPLLKPGAYIAFDDVTWTLADKESSLRENAFYKDAYDFDLYTEHEKEEAHIGIIVNEYFREFFGFEENNLFSSDDWKLLKASE